MEHEPREPGSEEYLDSEKYEIRSWMLDRHDSLRELIARVNRIRRENPALQRGLAPRLPRDRQRPADLLLEVDAGPVQRHPDGRQPRPALPAVGLGRSRPAGARPRRRRVLRGARPAGRTRATSGAGRATTSSSIPRRLPAHISCASTQEPAMNLRARTKGQLCRMRRADAPARARGSALVQGRDHLPAARQGVLRQQRRRHRRLSRPDRKARLHPGPGRQHDLAAAVLSVAAARRRLRHRRLPRRASRLRHAAPTSATSCARRTGAASRSSPSSSSTTPPTSIRGSRPRGGRRPARASATTTCGATPTRNGRRRGSSSPTPRSPTGPGTRSRRPYYWHRFFSHQPDLNFDNPNVVRAVIRVMRYWFDMGVDGMRLDAIPYLCERDGTNNENLPETHEVLKTMRAELDAHYQRPLLPRRGEPVAGGRPRILRRGDECHMAFHFPLMPRIYMAIAQEDRHPIVDIMQQTPDIPETCQWAIFLRNHDELTLEMVTSASATTCTGCTPPTSACASTSASAAGSRRSWRTTGPDQAPEQPAALHARLADHLLRRRDRHGRQHLSGRPERRAHADAMEPGPQRRVLAQRSAAPLPAADHGLDLRLRGGQRRGADARPLLAPQLDEARARRAPVDERVRPRPHALPAARATARSSPTSANTATTPILCVANLARSASRSSSTCALQGPRPGRDARPRRRSRRSASCPTC